VADGDQLGFSEMLWPDAKRGPWYVRANWVEIDGRPECAGLNIWKGARQDPRNIVGYLELPRTTPAPIGAAELRTLPIGTIINTLRQQAAQLDAIHQKQTADAFVANPKWARAAPDTKKALLAPVSTEWDKPRRGRPRDYGDEHFAEVARVYVDAWQGSAAQSPTQAVADHFGAGVTRSAAAKWVARARAMGMLGPALRGRAGVAAPKTKRTQPNRRTRRSK
jgi:hypothetical protein